MNETLFSGNELPGCISAVNLVQFHWVSLTWLLDGLKETADNENSIPIYKPYLEHGSSAQQTISVAPATLPDNFLPITGLGKRLFALRRKAIASGLRLLTEDEIIEEVKSRRGEVDGGDTDLY